MCVYFRGESGCLLSGFCSHITTGYQEVTLNDVLAFIEYPRITVIYMCCLNQAEQYMLFAIQILKCRLHSHLIHDMSTCPSILICDKWETKEYSDVVLAKKGTGVVVQDIFTSLHNTDHSAR